MVASTSVIEGVPEYFVQVTMLLAADPKETDLLVS